MIAAIIFLLLIFLYPLLQWVWGENEDASERVRKDEKYSFKKINAEINKMKIVDETARPAAVRIATDEYHLEYFGKNDEGLIVWTGTQLKYDFAAKETTDYTLKFLFDTSGEIVSSEIETVGIRSVKNQKIFAEKMNALVSANKIVAPASVMIKTFTVVHEGVEFGLIVRVPEEPEDVWAVEFMPGNTLAFFEPFDSGFYDT